MEFCGLLVTLESFFTAGHSNKLCNYVYCGHKSRLLHFAI